MYIIDRDQIRNGAITATSTAAGFSANNLKKDQKSSVWRSTDITAQTITATWAAAKTIDAVGIAFANFIVGSTVRVKLYTEAADVTPVADSGEKTVDFIYLPPDGFNSNNSSSFPYGGGNHFFIQVAQSSAKKMEVIMTNPAGVDSFIEVSRIVTAQASFFQNNLMEADISIEDSTDIKRTDGGNIIVNRKPIERKMRADLSAMSASERAAINQIIIRNGRHTPIFAAAHESASSSSLRADLRIYGYIENAGMMGILKPGYGHLSGMVITEI